MAYLPNPVRHSTLRVIVHRPCRLRDQPFCLGRQVLELAPRLREAGTAQAVEVSTIFLSHLSPNVYSVAFGLFGTKPV